MKAARDLFSSPVFWLCLLTPLVLFRLVAARSMEPVETLDTLSYEVLREFGFQDVLRSVRTYGYSAFLTLYDRLFADDILTPHSRLPELQFAVYWGAVLLFAAALALFLGSPGRALVASLPLAGACALGLLPFVEADFLALTFALVTMAVLLLVAARPANPWLWAALTLATFATYFVRPAYLFLLALVPCAGVLLRHCHQPTSRRRLVRHFAALVAVTWLPFLAYCGMRRAVVGEFALVSFTGYQLIGLSATFLDDELVADLPAEQRPFARRILELRRARGWTPLPPTGPVQGWFFQQSDNMFEIAEPVIRGALMEERDSAADRAVAEKWALSRHDIEVPPLSGEIVLVTNRRMGRLAREILERRPRYWLRWIWGGVLYGLAELESCRSIRWLVAALLLSLPVAVLRLGSSRRRGVAGGRSSPVARRLVGFALTGSAFFLLKLVLVSTAHWPLNRFAIAMHLFLPSILALLLFELWRRILGPGLARGSRHPPAA